MEMFLYFIGEAWQLPKLQRIVKVGIGWERRGGLPVSEKGGGFYLWCIILALSLQWWGVPLRVGLKSTAQLRFRSKYKKVFQIVEGVFHIALICNSFKQLCFFLESCICFPQPVSNSSKDMFGLRSYIRYYIYAHMSSKAPFWLQIWSTVYPY